MGSGDVVPRPDPTILTTQQLATSIAALRELFAAEIRAVQRQVDDTASLREQMIVRGKEAMANLQLLLTAEMAALRQQIHERDTRSDLALAERRAALSTALDAAKDALDQTKIAFSDRMAHLQELFDEQIRSIQGRFAQSDVAIAAALQAAKEAVTEQNRSNSAAIQKSENAVGEQIRQINELIRTSAAGTTAQLGVTDARLTRLEEWRVVAATNTADRRVETHDSKANSFAIGSLAIAAVAVLLSLFVAFNNKGGESQPVTVAPRASSVDIQPQR
jgi:hypothetical protein